MEAKDNSGALFKNDRKDTDKQPDYKGEARIKGQDYWLSAWVNESAKGTKYMGLKLSLKEEAPAAKQEKPTADFDDDLPF